MQKKKFIANAFTFCTLKITYFNKFLQTFLNLSPKTGGNLKKKKNRLKHFKYCNTCELYAD